MEYNIKLLISCMDKKVKCVLHTHIYVENIQKECIDVYFIWLYVCMCPFFSTVQKHFWFDQTKAVFFFKCQNEENKGLEHPVWCVSLLVLHILYLLSKRLSVCCLIVVYKSLFLSRSAISYFRLVLRGWSKVCTSVTTGFLHSILLGKSLFYSAILKFKR